MAIKPWLLPLIVIVLIVPATAGFLVAGPGLGLAIGALVAAAVVVAAVLIRPDEPIEVARSGDRLRRLLLVVIEPLDEPAAVETVRAAAQAAGAESEVLVMAPALNTPLAHWASDLGRSRLDAQRKLVLTIGALAAAEVEARGRVGDPDPLQAVEDTLREFAADEVIVVLPEDSNRRATRELVGELRRRLDLPVHPLVAGATLPGIRQ